MEPQCTAANRPCNTVEAGTMAYNDSDCGRMLTLHNAVASWLLQPSVESITLLTSHPRVCAALREWSWSANLAPSAPKPCPSSDGYKDGDDLDGGMAGAGTDAYGEYSSRGEPSTPPHKRKNGRPVPWHNLECIPPPVTPQSAAASIMPPACHRVPTSDGGWASHPVSRFPAANRDGSSSPEVADGLSPASAWRRHRGPARLKCVPLTDPSCYRPAVVPGVPTVQCVFQRGIAEAMPSSPVLMMINADIVLPEDIGPFVMSASGLFPRFLAVGRRVDIVGGLPRHLASYQPFWQHAEGADSTVAGQYEVPRSGQRVVGADREEGAGRGAITANSARSEQRGPERHGQRFEEADELPAHSSAVQEWRDGLLDVVTTPKAFLHGIYGLDYFIFSRPTFCKDPDGAASPANFDKAHNVVHVLPTRRGFHAAASRTAPFAAQSLTIVSSGTSSKPGGVGGGAFGICRRPYRVLPFLVGRQLWDGWLLHSLTSRPDVTTIDATRAITVFHLNPPGLTAGGASAGRVGTDYNKEVATGRRGPAGLAATAAAASPPGKAAHLRSANAP
eukprot:jgi/Mesvir1/4843/Mv11121-RA.1